MGPGERNEHDTGQPNNASEATKEEGPKHSLTSLQFFRYPN